MAEKGIGARVVRKEDQRFVTGKGRYTDDINQPGQAFAVFVRSPHPHAKINGIDKSAAEAMPGVLAVLTGEDVAADKLGNLICGWLVKSKDGSPMKMGPHPLLAQGKARYVGDRVAVVVADTLAQAKDAAEAVAVDYTELPSAASVADAHDAPLVHDEVANNLIYDWELGDKAAVDAAFAQAAHVTKLDLVNNRLVPNPMEPRAAIGHYDAGMDSYTCYLTSQNPHVHRLVMSAFIGLAPEHKLRVVAPDVGGGFGMKAMFYPEYTMAAAAAKMLGRPVKWTSERSEGFLSDSQGRDHVTTAELAFDGNKRILAMRVTTVANMGAYYYFYAPYIPTGAALKVLPGVYDIPFLSYGVKAVFTNTVPVDAYRGAGRPESIYCIERVIEQAAHELGVDVLELRRINFIKPEQMPYTTSAGELYDSGEFARVMDTCLKKADWAGVAARKAKSKAAGKLRGIGMCYYIESTMGDQSEFAGVRFDDDGGVSLLVGTQSNGQGHETAYAQVLNMQLGVPFEKIRLVQGDTARIKVGGGTGGSRSLTAQWTAMTEASNAVIDKGKAYASQVFEAAKADITFDDGVFAVAGTDRTIGIMELAKKAKTMTVPGVEGGLDADGTGAVKAWTFPNGCHIAEVEVDPDTGIVEVERYNIVDDFGVILNPMLVEGQVHGGIVQGIGQALLEQRGLRRGRPAPERLLHGLLHAARRRRHQLRGLDARGALQEQSHGHQGLRRGRRDRLPGGLDAVAQRRQPRRLRRAPRHRAFAGDAEADDRRHVLGAGAQAALLAAAGDQRREFDALVDHQRAGTERAADLVRRQRHAMHAQGTKIDVDLAEGLHRVGVKPRTRRPRLRGERGDVLQHAGFVIGEHHRHQPRTLRQHRLPILEIDPPLRIDRDLAHHPAGALQLPGRLAHTGVLDAADGHQRGLHRRRRTLQEQVVRFRSATGEHHLGRMRTDRRGDARARLVDRGARLAAVLVPARGIAEARRLGGAEPGQHGLAHRRIERRGGVPVEVDRRETHCQASDRRDFAHARQRCAAPDVAQHGHVRIGLHAPVDQRIERHRIEVGVHALVQVGPQVVGHAAVGVVAVLLAAALGRVERLIHRDDDLGHGDVAHVARQTIAAARAAHAAHQIVPAQLAEQLLEVGQRDLLTLGDASQRDRPVGLAGRQIDHRRDGKSALGRESHARSWKEC